MTTHRGSIRAWGDTLDDAIHKAHTEIATHVGERPYAFRTDSEPEAYFVNGKPAAWRVDVTWWVIDPAPGVPLFDDEITLKAAQ